MKQVLIFAGTTEGRRISEWLSESGVSHTVSVATEYGEILLEETPYLTVRRGRMTIEEMRALIKNHEFSAVVDATHPYADAVTGNIRKSMEGMTIPYIRLRREIKEEESTGEIVYFADHVQCVRALEEVRGNILLTTGSKELSQYCRSEQLKERLYVRILPGMESLTLCDRNGIRGKQIIAMQGPFTEEMNEALIHQFQIACLVTKQSGNAGGYPQKIAAAAKAGIPVFVIGHEREEGMTFQEVCARLEELCDLKIQKRKLMRITLAGIGMGNRNTLTKEAEESIDTADILLGAERMIRPYYPRLEKKPYYRVEEILLYLKAQQELLTRETNVVILFSGDSGFYSGSSPMYRRLKEEIEKGRLFADLRVLPGISSVSYLAACVGESYQDARILSMHGKEVFQLARQIRTNPKTYLLMSGVQDVQKLGRTLLKEGLESCEVITGYQLSYENQEICTLTPMECSERKAEGLYTCLIRNPYAERKRVTHGFPDEAFLREKVPMTKEEVREAAISKLRLYEGAVVCDIGSGTGSIAVEIAGISDRIFVYAVEKKKEAVLLTRKNQEKFGVNNMQVVEGEAPDALAALPSLTHAFIGGSSGNMREILDLLYEKNPKMRIVISAVTMETICEIQSICKLYPMEEEEIVQMQISRAKPTGSYHLMRAENPVWLCAFRFQERK